jgi:tetratricopeptide (TPR) repeat protein
MMDWSGLLLDLVKGGLGAAAGALPQHWRRDALARFNDANPFRSIARNDDLLRACRLAWIEAALRIVDAAKDAPGTDVKTVVKSARQKLKKARSIVFNRDIALAPSPIDDHLQAIMNGVAEPVAGAGPKAEANKITRGFAATFCAVIDWPLDQLPSVFKTSAALGLAVKGGAPREFGELAFAEFAEILKNPKKYPEAGQAFFIATEELARNLAKQTFAAVRGLDAKVDAALAQLGALETLHAGIDAYLALLPGIADDVRATREGVEQNSETLAEVKQTLSEVKALSEQQREQFLTQLVEMSKQNGDLGARHGALLNLVKGFVASITRESVPEDQIPATLFRMAAEWNDAGLRIDALAASKTLTPKLHDLMRQALEARASGQVERAGEILAQIAAQEREDEERLTVAASEIAEQLAARRAGRVATTDAQIAVALSNLRAKEAARFIVEKLDLEAQDPARRFAALRSAQDEYYVQGRDKGVNLDLEVAIELAQISVERASGSDQRGQALNNLGECLKALGERESDPARLGQAVVAFRALLVELTRESAPLEWAIIQNNFGTALQRLGERESDPTRLWQAVEAYRIALVELTRERAPLKWAITQTNLGAALFSLGRRESDPTLLRQAVEAYRAALEEGTRERAPLQWATTQNNLGNALSSLGECENNPARLRQAVEAYRSALMESTRERVPFEWAMTQNNLGIAFRMLGERARDPALLRQSVDAYRAALEELTRERVPLDWAATQSNLGAVLSTLGEYERDPESIRQAFEAFRMALEERTRERVPAHWATTQINFGNALSRLGNCDSDPMRLRQAVEVYCEALVETTRERVPFTWAQTRQNIADTFLAIYRLTGEEVDRAQALEAVDDSLVVYRNAQSAYDIGRAEALRARILAARADAP